MCNVGALPIFNFISDILINLVLPILLTCHGIILEIVEAFI